MLHYSYQKHNLKFKIPARTSRGEMNDHAVFLINCFDIKNNKIIGVGEASPLPGLSIDDTPDFENKLQNCIQLLNENMPIEFLELEKFPSIQFALETAHKDLNFGGNGKIVESDFINGKPIPINGLVWMAEKNEMLKQVEEKISKGYKCIKIKIGNLDFDDDCRMLESIRKKYNSYKVELRLDANGAFKNDDSMQKLNTLFQFEIHSIEQPIKQGQWELMQEICAKSKINIALDEELIGIEKINFSKILHYIKPKYIVLKPTLLGGFELTKKWIDTANKHEINWWLTSALESNIALNAIAQFASSLHVNIPQGLGTGELYENNFPSKLVAEGGFLHYKD